jgi:DNA polymerase-3 subunit beta
VEKGEFSTIFSTIFQLPLHNLSTIQHEKFFSTFPQFFNSAIVEKNMRNFGLFYRFPPFQQPLLLLLSTFIFFFCFFALSAQQIKKDWWETHAGNQKLQIERVLSFMKFTCEKQALYQAVTYVSKGVAQKSTIPALEGIRMQVRPGRLQLTGYDLEFGIQTHLAVDTADTGEFVINARLLSESVRRFSGTQVTITVTEQLAVTMQCDATEFRISAMSAEDYPALPTLETTSGLTLEQPILRSMIHQTYYAASLNENKPVFTGELFETVDSQLRVVAIDGYRLAIRTEPIAVTTPQHFVVPKRTLLEVASMLKDDAETPCIVTASRNHIAFSFNGYLVFSRLLEGEFHNYQSSIPANHETEVILKTADLISCLERCSLLINSKFNAPICCTFSEEQLNIRCQTGIGKINDTIPAQITGPDVTIGFNNRYLLEAAKAADCDQVRLQLSGGNHVAKMVPMQGEAFIFLLMPIQLR